VELIDDHRDIGGPLNICGPESSGNLGVTVLHVQDHDIVARMAKEMLETEGWEVETCADGNIALDKICGHTRYDLLLLDYDLPRPEWIRASKPGAETGSPLTNSNRPAFGYRQRQPHAMPVQMFLQKPQDIGKLVETITRLVSKAESESSNA